MMALSGATRWGVREAYEALMSRGVPMSESELREALHTFVDATIVALRDLTAQPTPLPADCVIRMVLSLGTAGTLGYNALVAAALLSRANKEASCWNDRGFQRLFEVSVSKMVQEVSRSAAATDSAAAAVLAARGDATTH